MALLDDLRLYNQAGSLVVKAGDVRLRELPTRPHTQHSRAIYVDDKRTFAAKVEHSYSPWKREPYQCWNEYTLWDEYLSESDIALEWVAPTLEMSVYACPLHTNCVVSVCVQAYIEDGWPDITWIPRAQPGDLDILFDAFPMLQNDVGPDRITQQCVFSREHGHVVLVDYGYQSASGVRLPSRRRPDGFWAWVRRAITRSAGDS